VVSRHSDHLNDVPHATAMLINIAQPAGMRSAPSVLNR
jgi:hypothetical protein